MSSDVTETSSGSLEQSLLCAFFCHASRYNMRTMIMAIKHKNETFLTTSEAAAFLGFSEHTIRQYIRRNKISAIKHGDRWAVSETECKRYRKEKLRIGRPRKK